MKIWATIISSISGVLLFGCAQLECADVIEKEVQINNKFLGTKIGWYTANTGAYDALVVPSLENNIRINKNICSKPDEIEFIIKHEFGHFISYPDLSEDSANIVAGAMYREQGKDFTNYIAMTDKLCSNGSKYWCDRSYFARFGYYNYYSDFNQ